MTQSLDEGLARLKLPMAPAELFEALNALMMNSDSYTLVADRNAQKVRDCVIAGQFLMAHSTQTGRKYEITKVVTEAPDIEYRDVMQPTTILTIEATELVDPNRKRDKEYLHRRQQREACERAGKEYEPPSKPIPQKAIEADRRMFPNMASDTLRNKLRNDYGSNCTLVLAVSLSLYGDEPIRQFTATYPLPEPMRFHEMWFLYGGDTIIPLYPVSVR